MNSSAIIEHITQWLYDYAQKVRVQGFVVGISGGVDSAVVSSLCARTQLRVLCLDLPIRQNTQQHQRAQTHIAALTRQFPHTSGQSIDLTPTFEQFERDSSQAHAASPHGHLALANARSRLRMMALYYFAQIHGLLVVGTGNRVEDFGVGFFTKYGDGGVDLSPIAGLLKSQVYALAKALKIDQSIIEAPPTDGLWDEERTDEQQMGASYPELEQAMLQYEQGKRPDDLQHGRERDVLSIYQRLHLAAQHKIQPIPICPIPEQWLNPNPI